MATTVDGFLVRIATGQFVTYKQGVTNDWTKATVFQTVTEARHVARILGGTVLARHSESTGDD